MADIKMEADPRFRKQGLPDSVKLAHLSDLLYDALISTNHVQQCALVQRDNDVVIATSVGFKLYPEQAQTFTDAFKSIHHTRQYGMHYNGLHYNCLRADAHSIYAQTDQRDGLLLVQTKSHILMASYTQSMYASVAVEAVEQLADYLRERGK